MKDITQTKNVASPVTTTSLGSSKRINLQISEFLFRKCQNLVQSQHLAQNYTYSSVSDLIRKSLIAYQTKKLNLSNPRPTKETKKTIGLSLPRELWEFHQSLPARHRTEIIELCLVNYLNTI